MFDFGRAFYEKAFRLAYLKSGNAFQDLFSTLMEKRYPGDFVRVRPWGNIGDRKNDGYLRSQRKVFQAYAPRGMHLSKLLAKIQGDFLGALEQGKTHFDVWTFVHNDDEGLPTDALNLLLELSTKHHPVKAVHCGYEELLREFMQLSADDMAAIVGQGPSLDDLVSIRVQDVHNLLQHLALQPEPATADVRPVPADKLQHNQLSDGTAALLKFGMTRAETVRKYLRGLSDPTGYDKFAAIFRKRYDELKAAGRQPDDIFVGLQRFVGGDQVPSPREQAATVAILAFFFETCEIFERPPEAAGKPS